MTVVDVNTGKFTGSGRQPRADGHQEQPRGGRGDRAPAAAARHRRHRGHRLHRHGAGVQPRPGAAAADRGAGPRPHPSSGVRGDIAGSGPADPQAVGHRPDRGVLDVVSELRRARDPAARRPGGFGPGDRAQVGVRAVAAAGARRKKNKADEQVVAKVPLTLPGEHPMFKAMAAGSSAQSRTTNPTRPPKTPPTSSTRRRRAAPARSPTPRTSTTRTPTTRTRRRLGRRRSTTTTTRTTTTIDDERR